MKHVGEPVTPAALSSSTWLTVRGGANAAGRRGDAVVEIHRDEHSRRSHAGLAAITSRSLLHVLVTLPWGTPVHTGALDARDVAILAGAPDGVVDIDGAWVTRQLRSPVTVVAALVEGTGWRRVLGRVAHFAPFCQMIAVFPAAPAAFGDLAWEAQFDGIGVWIRDANDMVEAVRPAPFMLRYRTAAGWAFHENAYRQWLRATLPAASSGGLGDHRVHTATAASDPHQLPLPAV